MIMSLGLCLLALMAGGCHKKPTQPPVDRTVIKGTVVDSLSGQPLPGTVITLNTGLTTTSDSRGDFKLTGMGGGNFSLTFDKPDWRLGYCQVAVDANDSVIVDFKLHPCQWETVTVVLPWPWEYFVIIKDLCFVNEREGWAVGFSDVMGMDEGFGIILKTSDGGYTWQMQYGCPNVNQSIWDIDFVDNQHGWACGKGGANLLRTTDGGNTWNNVYNFPLKAISFVNRKSGLLSIGEFIYRTDNGGDSIYLVDNMTIQLGDEWYIYKIKCLDQNKAWARSRFKLFSTIDGGYNWSLVLDGLPPPFGSVWLNHPTVALECLPPGYVWVEGKFSRDNGATWEDQPSSSFGEIAGASFPTPAYGWMIGGYGFMIHTVDSGKTWVKYDFPDHRLLAIHFLSPRMGWVFAKVSGPTNRILIYK